MANACLNPAFLAKVNDRIAAWQRAENEWHARWTPNVPPPTVEADAGARRFLRIVKRESHGQRSVLNFIECATGDIYKAHGWKGPAKGIRGNIYDDSRFGPTARAW